MSGQLNPYAGAVHAADESGSGSLVVEDRVGKGFINYKTGRGLQVSDVDCTAALLALAQHAGSIATGTVVLDGSNPTTVATGLNTVAGGIAVSQQATAPGLDPTVFTCHPNATPGSLDIYAWKATSNADPTLVASTNNTVTVAWIAFGT